MDSFDIKKYINIAIKRKWFIIIPFLVALLGGFAYLLKTPKVYESDTLILVLQQKVPENYVQSTVSTTLEEMLTTITQQVQSRTNLENIIKEFGLYESTGGDLLLEDKIAIMRSKISINVSTTGRRSGNTNAFTIGFRNEDPKKAMEIANVLAANVIYENTKLREEQATGTSTFLSEELKNLEKRLENKEAELKAYNERYMGGLPDQLETNLSILTRLQSNLDQMNLNLRDAENRKITISKDIAAAKASQPSKQEEVDARQNEINSLKSELVILESKYTESHPDIIRTKSTIEKLEKEREQALLSQTSSGGDEVSNYPENSLIVDLERQEREIESQISSYKAKIEDTNDSINFYQSKVDSTPKRQQELLILERDYNNLKASYSSLLNRQLESELSVNMEKKQKGEQFKIIDPAQLPETPVEPDVKKIIMTTLCLGLGLGVGLAYLVEMMDTSYKSPDDIEKDLQLPILINYPTLMTEKEIWQIKRNKIIAYTSVVAGFILSAVGIVFAVKGVEASLSILKGFLGNT